MKVVAIIPAKGGSKRLPRKNIVNFRGKPIIDWTIKAAIDSGIFERIVVSTEDDEIAEIASKRNIDLDNRSERLSSDKSTVDQVCLDFLINEEKKSRYYDVICCLYATAPLRNAEDIINTVDLVTSQKSEQAMAVTNFSYPAFQAMFINGLSELNPLFPELIKKRSSELEEIVVDNGSTYVSTVKAFRREGSFISNKMLGYKMPKNRSVDIDYEEDLKLAEMFAEMMHKNKTQL